MGVVYFLFGCLILLIIDYDRDELDDWPGDPKGRRWREL